MSDYHEPDQQNRAEPPTLPEIKVIPEKKSIEPKAIPSKAVEAKATPTVPAKAGGAGGAAKKPAKKIAKSWPSVNALITAFSLTATLGGWAHFTVQEMRQAEAEAAAWAASQAVVAPAVPVSAEVVPAPTYTLDIALPPIPTVVPARTFNLNSAPVDTAAVVAPAPASVAPAVAPAAPVLRSVAAPPPPVISAPAPAAPAPAASTSSSR